MECVVRTSEGIFPDMVFKMKEVEVRQSVLPPSQDNKRDTVESAEEVKNMNTSGIRRM